MTFVFHWKPYQVSGKEGHLNVKATYIPLLKSTAKLFASSLTGSRPAMHLTVAFEMLTR